MRAPDLRLAPAALAAWLTAGLLVAVPVAAVPMCAVAATAVVAILTSVAIRAHIGAVSRLPRVAGAATAVAAAVGLCAAAIALAAPVRHPDGLAAVGAHTATVTGQLVTGAVPAPAGPFGGPDRFRFRLRADTVSAAGTMLHGRMPALVTVTVAPAELPVIGETVRVRGSVRVQPPADDTTLLVTASGLHPVAAPAHVQSWTAALRGGFAAAAARLPGDGGRLLPGLAIGDVSRVTSELDADMKSSSLSHLTAVSGSNCAVVVAGLLALAAALGLPRTARVVVALLGLAGFVTLVMPGASVLRAAVMAAIVVFGAALGRPSRAVPALALAVLVLLVHDPWLSRDYGFALSVAATAALLLLAPPLATRLARVMPRWLAVGLSVPVAAQLACQPILVLLNPTLPVYGVVANALAEPAAAPATVLGLIGCLLLPPAPWAAAPLLWAAWAPAAWIAAVAHRTVALPASALPWPGGPVGIGLAAALTGLVVVALLPVRRRWPRGIRTLVAFCCCGALVVAAGLQAGPALAGRITMPRDWTVGMCDIGQGDAVLLHSGGAYGLIDTGPDPAPLRACLDRLGIRRLALLVLTHYDLDHVGGLDAVVGRADLALVGPPDDRTASGIAARLTSAGARVHVAQRGDTGRLAGLSWQVLWPAGGALDALTSNERGVTLSVTGDGARMLFLADLDESAQTALLRSGPPGPVDVVKVAHHGSADQSERLYLGLHARLGLISAGAGNAYGHPTAAALRLLRAAGTEPARTDLEGMVLVRVRRQRDGPELLLWAQRRVAEAALWRPARR